MEARARICQQTSNNKRLLSIIDLTRDYQDESSESIDFQIFKKSDLVSVDVVDYITIDKTERILDNMQTPNNESTVYLESDGWYSVHHILLPTKEWFDKAKTDGSISNYSSVYFTDGNKYYKYQDTVTLETTVDNIIAEDSENTTISIINQDVFSIFYLMTCYIKLAENLLNLGIKCKKDSITDITFNRDLVWMSINVIQYLVEMNDLEQATVILYKLNQCNGVCKSINIQNTYSCGCSR